MEVKNYIFLTTEEATFQPGSESEMPDIDNVQVIGFAKGKNPEEALAEISNCIIGK